MHCVQNLGAVVAVSTDVADADDHVFEDDKSFPVLEDLALYHARAHGSVAVFAFVSVHDGTPH
jgi:hypothetical protein